MSNTFINAKYIIARYYGKYAHDFLYAWDEKYGASFSGVNVAMVFDTKAEAIIASLRAAKHVPHALDGLKTPYKYTICATL